MNLRLTRWTIVLCFVVGLLGCASTKTTVDGSSGLSGCIESENLLANMPFQSDLQGWQYAQHTGDISFKVSAESEVLTIERIGPEPWMLMYQIVKDKRLAGSRILFEAELRGDAPSEPEIHGFEHKAGLYLKADGLRTLIAEHEPNKDTWDWTSVSYEEVLSANVRSLRAGFAHQSGGSISARNAKLVVLDCGR